MTDEQREADLRDRARYLNEAVVLAQLYTARRSVKEWEIAYLSLTDQKLTLQKELDTARQQLELAESFKHNAAHAAKLDREAAEQREAKLRRQLADRTNQYETWVAVARAAEQREERMRKALLVCRGNYAASPANFGMLRIVDAALADGAQEPAQ